jgi:integration host factor subunit beta
MERTLTRTDLIEGISKLSVTTKHEANSILDVILGSMARALRNGDKVEIRGFGSFHTRQRRGRLGRNPKTGAIVEVPPRQIAYFKPSKGLTAVLNSS